MVGRPRRISARPSEVVGGGYKALGEPLGQQLELGAVVAMERGDDTVDEDLDHAEHRRLATAWRAMEGEVKAELVTRAPAPTLDQEPSTARRTRPSRRPPACAAERAVAAL